MANETKYDELGWQEIILLGTAIRKGLLEAISVSRRSSEAVANDLGLYPRAVYTIFSALSEYGFVEEDEDGFGLPQVKKGPLLDPDDPEYVGGLLLNRLDMVRSWSRLSEVLETGVPVENRVEPDFAGEAAFIKALRYSVRDSASPISEAVMARLPEGARILDVGGGPGTNAEAFVRDGARVTVFDRPEVISLMESVLSEAGISTVAGDMNEGLPEGPFEAIYFGNTSHMYGPEENRELFSRMRRSLAPGGLLVLREFVRGMSEGAARFAVNMLVLTPGGGTYTADEYEELLLETGFEAVEVERIRDQGTHLIFARRS
jgi:ubiquinone/menaquinone biosynthesis C-methylase UbiE